MKTKRKKTLRQLAAHYRKTGEYLPEAELAEYRMLQKRWGDIEKLFLKWRKAGDDFATLKNHVGLEIGTWQAHHGFVRPFQVTLAKAKKK